jgi:triosephosphate isomerase
MNKIIIANWKMNPASLRTALRLARASDKKGVVVVPPFVFTEEVGKILRRAKLGAQDVSREDPPSGGGPYTGEVSWRELKKLGVEYVIVGHSERRAMGERNGVINRKLKIAISHGLKVILCVGEKSSVRRRGKEASMRFVGGQIASALRGVTGRELRAMNLLVAYEPVWAIGTGRNDTPADASEMAEFIRKRLSARCKPRATRVLYGGSVNPKNAKSFLTDKNMDGLLVGGASLSASGFGGIINAVKKK